MQILKAIPLQNGNFRITFDDTEQLEISPETYLFTLKKGAVEISEELLSTLREESIRFKIKAQALRYLAMRHHSTAELQRKLLLKGFTKTEIRSVTIELINAGLLNDNQFAESYFQELISKNRFSRAQILLKLQQKGIQREITKKIFEKTDTGKEHSFEEALAKEVNKKILTLQKKGFTDKEIYVKAFMMISGKGFPAHLIKAALKKKLFNQGGFDN